MIQQMLAIWSLIPLFFLNPEFSYVFSILKCTVLAGGNPPAPFFFPIGGNTVQDSDFSLAYRHWPVFCTCSLSTQAHSCHLPQEHILGASCTVGGGMILKFPPLWIFNGHLGDLEVRPSLQLMNGLSIGVQDTVSWNCIPLMPSDIPIYLFPHLPLPLPSQSSWYSGCCGWEMDFNSSSFHYWKPDAHSLLSLSLAGEVADFLFLFHRIMFIKLTYLPTPMHSNVYFLFFIFLLQWSTESSLET